MKYETIGSRILALRTEAGLSKKELAKKAGARTTDVSMWERGAYPPRTRQLKGLADALGVSVAGLLSDPSEGLPADSAALDTLLAIAETQQKTENKYRRFLLITSLLVLLVVCVVFVDPLLLFFMLCVPVIMLVVLIASIVYFFLFRRTQRGSYASLVIGGVALLLVLAPEAILILSLVLLAVQQ